MRFLLDTDTDTDTDTDNYALRGEGDVAEKMQIQLPSELGISSITLAELRFGAALGDCIG